MSIAAEACKVSVSEMISPEEFHDAIEFPEDLEKMLDDEYDVPAKHCVTNYVTSPGLSDGNVAAGKCAVNQEVVSRVVLWSGGGDMEYQIPPMPANRKPLALVGGFSRKFSD